MNRKKIRNELLKQQEELGINVIEKKDDNPLGFLLIWSLGILISCAIFYFILS